MNTTLGHMYQQQQKVHSKQQKWTVNIPAPKPSLKSIPVCMHHVYVNTFHTAGEIYIYLPALFAMFYNSINCYLLMFYDYDRNVIFSYPIKIIVIIK